jgi:putative transposase
VSFKSNRNVVYSCTYHVVFCPKYRRRVLLPPIDGRLKEIIRETCLDARSELIEIEVMPDHVHLLLDCDPQFGINRLVRSIKGRDARASCGRNTRS